MNARYMSSVIPHTFFQIYIYIFLFYIKGVLTNSEQNHLWFYLFLALD